MTLIELDLIWDRKAQNWKCSRRPQRWRVSLRYVQSASLSEQIYWTVHTVSHGGGGEVTWIINHSFFGQKSHKSEKSSAVNSVMASTLANLANIEVGVFRGNIVLMQELPQPKQRANPTFGRELQPVGPFEELCFCWNNPQIQLLNNVSCFVLADVPTPHKRASLLRHWGERRECLSVYDWRNVFQGPSTVPPSVKVHQSRRHVQELFNDWFGVGTCMLHADGT